MVGPFLDVPPSTTLMVLIDVILPPASACNFSSGEKEEIFMVMLKRMLCVVRTETGGTKDTTTSQRTIYVHKFSIWEFII